MLQHDGGCLLGRCLEGNDDIMRMQAFQRIFADTNHMLDNRAQTI
jgi:hypothetical protein